MKRENLSRSHSKGVVILIAIVIAIQSIVLILKSSGYFKEPLVPVNRVIVDSSSREVTKIVDFSHKIKKRDNRRGFEVDNKREKTKEIFKEFDPNLSSVEDFCKMGFSQRQAQSIINFREKSGGFKTPEDLKKVYVISDEMYAKILPFVKIFQPECNNLTQTATNISEIKAKGKVSLTELNEADSAQLVALPGIGPYFARKIIGYRHKLGGFASENQLTEIYGFDQEKIDMIKERVSVDTLKIKKIKIDTASVKSLASHPYIGDYAANAIIRLRKVAAEGTFCLALIIRNKIIKPENLSYIKYYFE